MDVELLHDSLLVQIAWQTTLWLAVGLGAAAFFRGRPARAHGVLTLCLLAAIATPLLTALFNALGWGALATVDPGASVGNEPPPPLISEEHGGIGLLEHWQAIVITLWTVASAVFLARLITSIARGVRLIRNSALVHDERLEDSARRAASRLGLRCAPLLLESADVSCPVIWCWGARPRVLLPRDAARPTNPHRLLGVICHELAHCRRRDHVTSLLAEIAVCLAPWQPLAWRARRRLADLSEEACDAWTLAAGVDPTSYADALLDLVPQRRRTPALAAAGSPGELRLRIQRILQSNLTTPTVGRRWTIAVACCVMCFAATAALAQRRAPIERDKPIPRLATDSDSPPVNFERDPASPYIVDVTPRELDLGIAPPGGTATGSVWLVNTGDDPVRLLDVKASCGCTVVSGFEPSSLAPRGWLKLDITMTAPDTPDTNKTKHVTFRVEGQPPLRLPVHLRTTGRAD